MLKITFVSPALPTQDALILTVTAERKLGAAGVKLDQKLGGILSRAMENSAFKGDKAQTLSILAPGNSKLSRLVLVGLGDPKEANDMALQQAGSAALAALQSGKDDHATLLVDAHKGMALDAPDAAAQAAFGARLRSYRFDKYRTKLKPDQKPALKTLAIAGDVSAVKAAYQTLDKVADGVFFTRDLVSEPANVIYPETLAEQCAGLEKLGLEVEILVEDKLQEFGMGALLGVAQGSVRPARVVTLKWQGDKSAKDKRPVVFVGKGVTFDTGGISLKPPGGMEEMKWDMAGAGAVIGAMKALAGRKAKANVVGVIGLVENMPSGNAQRPGDIVTSMSGQTIEVINTDAEGRLVLADAMWYAQETFHPRCVIVLA